VSIPDAIREELTKTLWSYADELGWLTLAASSKSRYYDNWTTDPKVGGVLARFIDLGQARLYIKDALMKRYACARRGDPGTALSALGIPQKTKIRRSFVKPHGLLLADGRVVCWGRANNWKLILLAVHERVYNAPNAVPFGAVLTQAGGNFSEQSTQAVVLDAAHKLGIQQLRWLLT